MSIVKNSVLAGNGLTTDQSSSVVIWPSVVVSGVTYTFCEYITTNETNVPSAGLNNPTYIRDVAHKDIVRPTGHDYYPCYNGSTYGVYDKINHTFTAKTVTAHGEPQPYGVGIYDLMWATATGYTDLLTLCAVDGGTADVIENNPLHPTQSPLEIIETRTVGGSSTTRVIKFAFNIKDMPLPPSKTVIENSVSVTYTYAWGYIPTVGANGDLLYGRNPSWKIWADGSPINIRGNIGTGKWLIPNILVNDEVNLKWWDGYNNSKVYPPFLSSSSDTWEIEYHNGVYLRCNSQLRTAEGDRTTPNPTKQLWLYDTTTTNFPSIRMGIGNLPNWDGPSKGTMKVDIFAFMAAVQLPTAEVDLPLYIVKTLPFWADGTQALTNSTSGKFNSSTSASIKEKAKEGKSGGNYYDFTTGGVIVSPAISNALYSMLQRNNNVVTTEQELVLYTTLDSGDSHTETSNLVKPTAFTITKKDEGSSNFFRIALRTPTLTIGADTYTIINGVYANGGGVNTPNDPSQFVFSTSSLYTKSGLGMTFLCEQNGEAVANSGINCICVMELTVCDANKNVIGYGVFAKRNSKGIYYFQNTTNDADPDEEYRNSPFTYLSGTSFEAKLLATAKLTNGSTAYPDYDQYVSLPDLQAWEKAHTMKVAWWYGQDDANKIPSTMTNVDGAVTILKPNSTAVIGMYGDKNVLIPGFSTATDADWYEGGTLKGNLYNPSVAMFFTGFRGWEFNLNANSHKVFVFPYENVVDNNDYTILYFKRYKAVYVNSVLDHYITDNSSTPNTSINEVGTTTKAYYVLLFEFTNSAGTVSRGGGAFLKYDSVNFPLSWKLFSDDLQGANMVGVDIPNTLYHIDAYLDYVHDSAVNSKFFEVPQGLLGITNTLTTHGVFKLRIKTTGMPILGTLRWSIQDA